MALPTAVRRNAERAKRELAEANASSQANATENVDVNTTGETGGGTGDDQQTDTQVGEAREGFRPHVLSADQSQQASDVTATSEQTKPNPDEDWKARYVALRGSRDQQIVDLTQSVASLESTIVELRAAASSPAQTAPQETSATNSTSQADVQSQETSQSSTTNDHAIHDAEQLRLRSAVLFESDMSSLIPNWRETNKDVGWHAWLERFDPVTGIKRQSKLDQLVDAFDASSVAQMFRDYAASGAQDQTKKSGFELSPEVPERRASTGADEGAGLIEVWSETEIADFFKSKNRLYQSGKLVGDTLVKVQAEEARISKAISEGRVEIGV